MRELAGVPVYGAAAAGYAVAAGGRCPAAGVLIMKWFLFCLCYIAAITFAPFMLLPPGWAIATFLLGLAGIIIMAGMLEDWSATMNTPGQIPHVDGRGGEQR